MPLLPTSVLSKDRHGPDLEPSIPPLQVGTYTFASRLLVGTGKYASMTLMQSSLAASGCDVVTVAVRRMALGTPAQGSLLDHLDKRYQLLPNTAGCFSAEDALRTARLGRELGISDMVKLEVLADTRTLLPHPVQTLEATRVLVKEGFTVLVYTSDDPVLALEIESAGAHAVMPAGSPIGSGLGVLNRNSMEIILERAKGTDHHRCRCWYRFRCRDRHGARCCWCLIEYRHSRGAGSGAHGARHAPCFNQWLLGERCWAYCQTSLCQCVIAADRSHCQRYHRSAQ